MRAKKPRTGGPRMSLQLTLGGLESMEAFKTRLEHLKHAFVPAGVNLCSLLTFSASSSIWLSLSLLLSV